MALNYTVRVIDRLLRFDTSNDDVIVTLLPFVQTPNAPYEIHRISTGDGHTVTITVDPTTTDFLLPDGSTAITLDDANATVYIKIPEGGLSPAYVSSGGGGGGGGGTGGGGVPAPDVTIDPPAEVIFRSDHKVEVDVEWTEGATANSRNFLGTAIYLEDPDISSGANAPMDGASVQLDASAQVSGEWTPIPVSESTKSPAVLFLDSTMGSTTGQTYKAARNVRIYLAAYGPFSHPHLVRATDPSPTPSIVVNIPLGRGQGESGQEYAFLVQILYDNKTPPVQMSPSVTVTTDYNRPDPNYYLTFAYTPPDPGTPVPPGLNAFGGVRIIFVSEDAGGNPQFPGTDTGIDVPVNQSQTGYKSPLYAAGASGGKFRCYFCSEDDSQPLGTHINSLVEGTTPYAEAIVPPVPPTPNVTGFAISGQKWVWMLDGSFVAQASFAWSLPTASAGNIRYAGVYLYLVKVTGGTSPLTTFPQALTAQQGNVDTSYIMQISQIPANQEIWTIAAISVSVNGALADDPKKYGQPGFTSPTVTWNIGPPTTGSPGGGLEYAPPVTIGSATASASESLSADGVGMVSFSVGAWTNPTDNRWGSAQVAMVVNHNPTKPTYWSVPGNASSFVTPTMPSFGNIGAPVPVDFYVVSDDPQGNKNSLVPGTTPVVHFTYTPSGGSVIPSRSGWFDDSQFSWVGGQFTADNISAKIVQVGKTLVVGGAPSSFGASDNGQIAVLNASGKLLDWFGQQQPGQGNSAPLWGAWLGQVWIGGTNPLDAPVFIDSQGIIEVGGVAAAQGSSQYPYISVRDDHGYETGRIGAKLNVPSGSLGDGVGSNPPPQLTSGAWFTQLAVGGSNISNWNMLIIPDTTNPLGSQFQLRNVAVFSIDYPAHAGSPANPEYQMLFGSTVWTGYGATQWQFPGIHLYEVDGGGNNFGAVFLNRGMVLRGTQAQGYQTLVSLVTFNGQSSGSDSPPQFWGELAMYSHLTNSRTVYLASGSVGNGNAFINLRDLNGGLLFGTDQVGNTFIGHVLQGIPLANGASTPVVGYAYNVLGWGPVIDAAGNWVGRPIATGSQTPWTSNINGGGWSLSNVGSISASQYNSASGSAVIDTSGQFVGPNVNVGSGRVFCGSLTSSSVTDSGSLSVSGSATVGGICTFSNDVYVNQLYVPGSAANPVINNLGQFKGAGVAVGSYGVGCGGIICTGNVDVTGYVKTAATFNNNTGAVIDSAGTFVGSGGVRCPNSSITGYQFFASSFSVGSPVINYLGQFVGAGIVCPTYGVAASGVNPVSDGVHGAPNNVSSGQYYGATGYFNIGGKLLRFVGGILVTTSSGWDG